MKPKGLSLHYGQLKFSESSGVSCNAATDVARVDVVVDDSLVEIHWQDDLPPISLEKSLNIHDRFQDVSCFRTQVKWVKNM